MRKDLVAHGLATAGVVVTLLVLFMLAPVAPGTGSTVFPSSSSSPTASGLELHLSLNATSIVSGQSLFLTVWVYNPSPIQAEAAYAGNWGVQGMGVGPCGPMSFPMGLVIMKGNLSLAQVKTGAPLQLYEGGVIACPMILLYVQSYVFPSHSSFATLVGSCSPSECASSNMSASMTFSGDYGLLGFENFSPGVYTVVGGDEWGGLTLLHFTVTS